jgi:hypothetical protein
MVNVPILRKAVVMLILSLCVATQSGMSRQPPPPEERPLPMTPLKQDVLTLLANEVSGQMIYNNEVALAGAPWMRDPKEFTDTFYESQKIYDLVRRYGIETTEIQRFNRDDEEFQYPLEGELRMLEPEEKLIARLEADTALIARGTSSVDVTGSLVYIPPIEDEEVEQWVEAGFKAELKDTIALMWSHAGDETAKALDAAGVKGVISFNSRERYFDPDQVVYSRGAYAEKDNLKFGFSISWRQWSELLEDIEAGKDIKVRCLAEVESYPDKFETVFSWIPGTEPDAKGVVFTAHLFEGYTKRGANDNMSGCVIQLEILRALSKLIAEKAIPQPRRNIYFIWPNEISGTYEHIKQNPGFVDKLSINLNMDMVGEALRKNNSWFTMSECPNHLPSYLDGLADSMMNYVWRTNDIVYLPDSPRGRPGGQYFPRPMWEKNGSRDAFRYYVHRATGGSDHICFNDSSVAIPGIEWFTWPDQWYHADTDTPDKSDPTQMKRVAFIGAATALAAADCTDDVLVGLLEWVSSYGYKRIGERELPRAFKYLDGSDAENLPRALKKALNLASFAVERETQATQAIKEIYTGSEKAERLVDNQIKEWQLYLEGLHGQILKYAALKADQMDIKAPKRPSLSDAEREHATVIPAIHPDVKEKQFGFERGDTFKQYQEDNPDALEELGLHQTQRRAILNFVNGKRSVTKIRNSVIAETDKDLEFEVLDKYLEILKSLDWITY